MLGVRASTSSQGLGKADGDDRHGGRHDEDRRASSRRRGSTATASCRPTSIDDAAARTVAAEDLVELPRRRARPQRQAGRRRRPRSRRSSPQCTALRRVARRRPRPNRPGRSCPFGEATAAAAAAVRGGRAKVDDYFVRCRLAAFDPRALAAVNRTEEAYLDAAAQGPDDHGRGGRGLPARARRGRASRCRSPAALNPAWAGRDRTRSATPAVEPLLGHGQDDADRGRVGRRSARRSRPTAPGRRRRPAARSRGSGSRACRRSSPGDARRPRSSRRSPRTSRSAPQIDAHDAGRAPRALLPRPLPAAEQLRLLHATSTRAARRSSRRARCYLDGRTTRPVRAACDDAGKHGALAGMSRTYLAYVDCTRPGGEKMTVAAAFTAGDSDNLFVGRNGIFYDRKGRDWDATITQDRGQPDQHPPGLLVALQEAPALDRGQVAKRAAAADDAANAKLQAPPPSHGRRRGRPAPRPRRRPSPRSTSAWSPPSASRSAASPRRWARCCRPSSAWAVLMPLGLLGLVLLITGPSMIIAWLKLRRRNLGPILDANGWAVNALTQVNIPLGRSLTDIADAAAGLRALADRPLRAQEEPVAEDPPRAPRARGRRLRPLEDRLPREVGPRRPRPHEGLGPSNCTCPPPRRHPPVRRPPRAADASRQAGMDGDGRVARAVLGRPDASIRVEPQRVLHLAHQASNWRIASAKFPSVGTAGSLVPR